MALGDRHQVANGRSYQNQLGWQSPSHGYENNPHPTRPRNSNQDQANESYPSPYRSPSRVRPPPSSEPPPMTTGYGYGQNPPLIQPHVNQQADVSPPKHGNGYLGPRPNRAQVNERSSSPLKREERGYGRSYQNQLGWRSPSHGYENNPHPTEPRNEPRSNRGQVDEPYLSPCQSQPQVRPPPSSEPPPRTTSYGYGQNPPSIQPYVNQQADVSPPKRGNGNLEPRPNRAQVKERYSAPLEHEEGGYGGSNGIGHRPPPTEAKIHEDRQQNPLPVAPKPKQPYASPAVHGNGKENRLDGYTNPTQPQEEEAHSHGRGNYQSDQFNVHEHNPPSVTVKPHTPASVSVNGYPGSQETVRKDPQMLTQSRPYQDQGLGFADPNKRRLNTNKPKEVPSGHAVPPAVGHATRHGHPYEQSSPHKGDGRSPVSPADKQNLQVTVNVSLGQPGGQAPVHGSNQPGKGSNQSGSSPCCDRCSIM